MASQDGCGKTRPSLALRRATAQGVVLSHINHFQRAAIIVAVLEGVQITLLQPHLLRLTLVSSAQK